MTGRPKNTRRLKPTLEAKARATRTGERGYALLVVFLMAGMIALYLYAQVPRVAFESERDKEQSLIDRGEQYKRAIQLYVTAVKKYPQKIEDLENTNEKRYLRRRYIDPMTGKDEWRIIHVNAAGMLTDSLVQKPPTPDGKAAPTGGPLGTDSMNGSATLTGSTSTDPTNGTATNDVNAAVRRRPSDLVGQAYTGTGVVDPNDPKTWAPITIAPVQTPGTANGQPPSGAVGFNGGLPGQVPVVPGAPGQFPGQFAGGQPGAPGMGAGGFPLPGQPGFNPTQNQFKIDANGQLVPISPTQASTVVNSQTGGVPNSPIPTGVQTPGGGNPPVNTTPPNVPGMIGDLLRNPNPQAGAGLGTPAGAMGAGGIAGVASNFKGPSIKTYGGRQKYQEWEFIFSLTNGQNAPKAPGNPLQPDGPKPPASPGSTANP